MQNPEDYTLLVTSGFGAERSPAMSAVMAHALGDHPIATPSALPSEVTLPAHTIHLATDEVIQSNSAVPLRRAPRTGLLSHLPEIIALRFDHPLEPERQEPPEDVAQVVEAGDLSSSLVDLTRSTTTSRAAILRRHAQLPDILLVIVPTEQARELPEAERVAPLDPKGDQIAELEGRGVGTYAFAPHHTILSLADVEEHDIPLVRVSSIHDMEQVAYSA